MRALIVLPSFNERENIGNLIEELLSLDRDYAVCVVDDSSPDGTSQLVARTINESPGLQDRAHLITRGTKGGRGGAVRDGFVWGMASDQSFDAFVEMDCDFSHDPKALSEGLALIGSGYDVAVGARYPDGGIVGWPLARRIFSRVANWLARLLIDRGVSDYTNGFRFYSPRAVRLLLEQPQRHTGYIYLSESMAYLLKADMRIASFPIQFKNRERGSSNTGPREVIRALIGLIQIASDYHRPVR